MSWLDNEIIEGIQRLLILRLKNAPALDTIDLLVDTWVYVFRSQPIDWNEPLDRPRIRQAFLSCMGKIDEFPSPRTVMQYLPARADVLKIENLAPRSKMPDSIRAIFNTKVNESSQLTPEQRRINIDLEQEHLNELIRKMSH